MTRQQRELRLMPIRDDSIICEVLDRVRQLCCVQVLWHD